MPIGNDAKHEEPYRKGSSESILTLSLAGGHREVFVEAETEALVEGGKQYRNRLDEGRLAPNCEAVRADSGGSFDTAGASAQGQYGSDRNAFGAGAGGSMTDHYLNPVVPQNYSNTGTLGDFSVNYERDLTLKDRLRFIVRREFSGYAISNEQVRQAAGQHQPADNIETMGIASYQHTFSSNAVAMKRPH